MLSIMTTFHECGSGYQISSAGHRQEEDLQKDDCIPTMTIKSTTLNVVWDSMALI